MGTTDPLRIRFVFVFRNINLFRLAFSSVLGDLSLSLHLTDSLVANANTNLAWPEKSHWIGIASSLDCRWNSKFGIFHLRFAIASTTIYSLINLKLKRNRKCWGLLRVENATDSLRVKFCLRFTIKVLIGLVDSRSFDAMLHRICSGVCYS